MVAQAVLASGGNPDRFVRSLAWRLRFWLLGLPAGIGLATLKSILKLWMGVSWRQSGVYSAGNGPCMRAPILGVLCANDLDRCRELVRRSTLLTHSDPKAYHGALAIALAARAAALEGNTVSVTEYVGRLRHELGEAGEELLALLEGVIDSVGRGESSESFALSLGLERGVTGYVFHTVPVVLHAWLSHPADVEAAVTAVIRCGGDTDTTAALVGGMVGAAVGPEGIPRPWLDGLIEWPCGVEWMERLAKRCTAAIESGQQGAPLPFNAPAQVLRNLFFMAVVLFHGFRRLLPPY